MSKEPALSARQNSPGIGAFPSDLSTEALLAPDSILAQVDRKIVEEGVQYLQMRRAGEEEADRKLGESLGADKPIMEGLKVAADKVSPNEISFRARAGLYLSQHLNEVSEQLLTIASQRGATSVQEVRALLLNELVYPKVATEIMIEVPGDLSASSGDDRSLLETDLGRAVAEFHPHISNVIAYMAYRKHTEPLELIRMIRNGVHQSNSGYVINRRNDDGKASVAAVPLMNNPLELLKVLLEKHLHLTPGKSISLFDLHSKIYGAFVNCFEWSFPTEHNADGAEKKAKNIGMDIANPTTPANRMSSAETPVGRNTPNRFLLLVCMVTARLLNFPVAGFVALEREYLDSTIYERGIECASADVFSTATEIRDRIGELMLDREMNGGEDISAMERVVFGDEVRSTDEIEAQAKAKTPIYAIITKLRERTARRRVAQKARAVPQEITNLYEELKKWHQKYLFGCELGRIGFSPQKKHEGMVLAAMARLQIERLLEWIPTIDVALRYPDVLAVDRYSGIERDTNARDVVSGIQASISEAFLSDQFSREAVADLHESADLPALLEEKAVSSTPALPAESHPSESA